MLTWGLGRIFQDFGILSVKIEELERHLGLRKIQCCRKATTSTNVLRWNKDIDLWHLHQRSCWIRHKAPLLVVITSPPNKALAMQRGLGVTCQLLIQRLLRSMLTMVTCPSLADLLLPKCECTPCKRTQRRCDAMTQPYIHYASAYLCSLKRSLKFGLPKKQLSANLLSMLCIYCFVGNKESSTVGA